MKHRGKLEDRTEKMDEMDTSSSTGSASEKLSEGEELAIPNSKGDVPEPMVGSPPLFTAIPSTSAMLQTTSSVMTTTTNR